MIKAVIFDFDGTIADSVVTVCNGINLTMRHYGYPEHTVEEVLSYFNHGARELVRQAMPLPLQSNEELLTQVLGDYQHFYGEVYLQGLHAYAGLPELIERLHNDFRIGVLSNKPDVHLKGACSHVLKSGSFDAVQGMVIGKPTKPDPFLPTLLINALGVKPEECVMVGDSDVDVQTAFRSGMLHIGVSWGYRSEAFLRQNGAARIAHTPAELEAFLK